MPGDRARRTRSPVANWRDALRDDHELTSRAKAAGFVLSTYANGQLKARPGRGTVARGAGLSIRTIDAGLEELEARGYLIIDPPKLERPDGTWARPGGKQVTNLFTLTLQGAQPLRTSSAQNRHLNGAAAAHESGSYGTKARSAALRTGARAANNICPSCRFEYGQHDDDCNLEPSLKP